MNLTKISSKMELFFKDALETPVTAFRYDREGNLESLVVGGEAQSLEQVITKLVVSGRISSLKDKRARAFFACLADSYGYKSEEFLYTVCGHAFTLLDCSIVENKKGLSRFVNADFSLSTTYDSDTIGIMARKNQRNDLEEELMYKETMFALSDFNNRVARAYGYLDDATPLIDADTSKYKERVLAEIESFNRTYSKEARDSMLRNFEEQGRTFQKNVLALKETMVQTREVEAEL